jgi:metal-responsive CopG/Arc/MetJ family transcriptional regulator
MQKRKRGRPKGADSTDAVMYIRLQKVLKDALDRYRAEHLLPSNAEAVRDILKRALLHKREPG